MGKCKKLLEKNNWKSRQYTIAHIFMQYLGTYCRPCFVSLFSSLKLKILACYTTKWTNKLSYIHTMATKRNELLILIYSTT